MVRRYGVDVAVVFFDISLKVCLKGGVLVMMSQRVGEVAARWRCCGHVLAISWRCLGNVLVDDAMTMRCRCCGDRCVGEVSVVVCVFSRQIAKVMAMLWR